MLWNLGNGNTRLARVPSKKRQLFGLLYLLAALGQNLVLINPKNLLGTARDRIVGATFLQDTRGLPSSSFGFLRRNDPSNNVDIGGTQAGHWSMFHQMGHSS
jgi:hypothetical protein